MHCIIIFLIISILPNGLANSTAAVEQPKVQPANDKDAAVPEAKAAAAVPERIKLTPYELFKLCGQIFRFIHTIPNKLTISYENVPIPIKLHFVIKALMRNRKPETSEQDVDCSLAKFGVNVLLKAQVQADANHYFDGFAHATENHVQLMQSSFHGYLNRKCTEFLSSPEHYLMHSVEDALIIEFTNKLGESFQIIEDYLLFCQLYNQQSNSPFLQQQISSDVASDGIKILEAHLGSYTEWFSAQRLNEKIQNVKSTRMSHESMQKFADELLMLKAKVRDLIQQKQQKETGGQEDQTRASSRTKSSRTGRPRFRNRRTGKVMVQG